jgi:hypothetical protein
MPRYSLLIYIPADGPPADVDLPAQTERFRAYTERLVEAGVHRGGGRLHDPDAATTVRVRDGETQLIDGPFAETKEILAGYYILECPELDTALALAAQVPNADYASIEVRPIMELSPAAA